MLYILVSLKSINFNLVFSSFYNFSSFINSGFVFYGGVIGGIIGLFFINKIHSVNINSYLSVLIPCLSLSHAFGRIGCSFSGCCYGKETNFFLYFIYENNPIAPNGIKLFPVQGIESFFLFLFTILFVYLILSKKNYGLHYLYIILYSILRFILEYFRDDEARGVFLFLSTSQIISIFLFFISLSLYIIKRKKYRV